MPIKITGLNSLQRELSEAAAAIKELDGELTTVTYDPNNQASIESAISDIEGAIDAKVASFRGNALVEQWIESIKEHYRQELLDRAAVARLNSGAAAMTFTIDPTILRQIENVVSDLRNAEYSSFDKHWKKLSRLCTALHWSRQRQN